MRAFDEAVERAVAPWRGPALDGFFFRVSSAADHSLIWVAVLALRGLREPRLARAAGRLILALPVEFFVTNVLVKSLFRRLRPHAPSGRLPFGMRRPRTSAFPSGHAASAFMVATVMADLDPGRSAYRAAAAVVAMSRVYVRMHHASDVLAGAALGVVLGRLARPIIRAAPSRARRYSTASSHSS